MNKKAKSGDPGVTKKVGYGHPPEEHRFAKNKSGNPGGRKKKAAATSVPDIFKEQMERRLTPNGPKVKHLLAISAIKTGLKGEYKFVKYCFEQYGISTGSKQKISDEDKADLEATLSILNLDRRFFSDVADSAPEQDNSSADNAEDDEG